MCMQCGYDLRGLPAGAANCPECGFGLNSDSIAQEHKRRESRWWRLFLFSPILALPIAALQVVVQPLLALLLGAYFAWRAILHDDFRQRIKRHKSRRVQEAIALAFVWTICVDAALALVSIVFYYRV